MVLKTSLIKCINIYTEHQLAMCSQSINKKKTHFENQNEIILDLSRFILELVRKSIYCYSCVLFVYAEYLENNAEMSQSSSFVTGINIDK